MTTETALLAVNRFLELHADNSAQTAVRFFGGEPLLNWHTISEVLTDLGRRRYTGKVHLTTNGAKLTHDHINALLEFGTIPYVSVNGFGDFGNHSRKTLKGMPTYSDARNAIGLCLDVAGEAHIGVTLFGIESALGIQSLISDIRNLRKSQDQKLVFYLSFLKGKVNETPFFGREHEVARSLASSWRRLLDENIWIAGKATLSLQNAFRTSTNFTRWCESGSGIVVFPDGDIRSCSGTDKSLGSLEDWDSIFMNPAWNDICNRGRGNIPSCKNCIIEGLCGGSCSCSAGNQANGFKSGINCDLERHLFTEFATELLSLSKYRAICPESPFE